MHRPTRLVGTMLALILFCSSTSFSWNARGHMMVAAVAYDNLTQQTKQRVNALLRLNPDFDNFVDLVPAGTDAATSKKMIFMLAATWPDRRASHRNDNQGRF